MGVGSASTRLLPAGSGASMGLAAPTFSVFPVFEERLSWAGFLSAASAMSAGVLAVTTVPVVLLSVLLHPLGWGEDGDGAGREPLPPQCRYFGR